MVSIPASRSEWENQEVRATERGLAHLQMDFRLYPAAGSTGLAVERWRECLVVRYANMEGGSGDLTVQDSPLFIPMRKELPSPVDGT
jgi:hypothetical protein